MLVLTRRSGQSIMIHDPKADTLIEVVVTGVHGADVRLGVVAPRDIAVDRSEISERKHADASILTI